MAPVDLDAALETAREAQDAQCKHCRGKETHSAICAYVGFGPCPTNIADVHALAALVVAMADEIGGSRAQRARAIDESAILRKILGEANAEIVLLRAEFANTQGDVIAQQHVHDRAARDFGRWVPVLVALMGEDPQTLPRAVADALATYRRADGT